MMHRNLDRRVEALVQVKDPEADRVSQRPVRVGAGPVHAVLGTRVRRAVDRGATGGSHRARPSGITDGASPQQLRWCGNFPRHAHGPGAIPAELTCRSEVSGSRIVYAAGAVLWRLSSADSANPELEVAVIHRPRYDDWSLPKGKVDPGETAPVAAVREVLEETGQHAILGRRLDTVSYSDRPGRQEGVLLGGPQHRWGVHTGQGSRRAGLAARRRRDEETRLRPGSKSPAPLHETPGRHADRIGSPARHRRPEIALQR